jgi:hypothetical protein
VDYRSNGTRRIFGATLTAFAQYEVLLADLFLKVVIDYYSFNAASRPRSA